MLPDPDSNPELVATPAERGTSADATVLADANSRDRRAGCPLGAPAGTQPSDAGSAHARTPDEDSPPSPASGAPLPSACPFSHALLTREHFTPVIKADAQNEALEEHQQPSLPANQNSKECQRASADVFRNHDANAAIDVESVFLETCQSSDGNCVPTEEEASSTVDFAAASASPDSPDDRRPTDGFVESDLQYLQDEGPEVVDFFKVLLGEGRLKSGDCGVSLDSKPAWVDDEKVRLGQHFAQKYFFGLVFAEMISLFLLFSSPGSLHSLIFTGNSDTPFKAFRRYLSTVCRVRSWYGGDLWAREGDARRNLRAVRQLHAAYRQRLNALNAAPPQERARRTALRPPLWTRGAARAVRDDFADLTRAADACPFFGAPLTLRSLISSHHEWINQMEMSVTQFGFVALAVTYPERFGAGGASEAELDAFVHLWRVLGHLLGVEERFNFCAGGLAAVRARSRALVRRFLAPALARVDASWEHMTRCVVEGVSYYVGGMTYEVALLYLCETVGAPAPRVLRTLSARQLRMHRAVAFLLRWALRLAPLRALFNWLLALGIKRARAASPEWLRRREARVYDYERPPAPHAPHAHAGAL